MAGYSGTPLPRKLGIGPGAHVALLGAPADFRRTLGELPAGVTLASRFTPRAAVVVLFATRRAELARRLAAVRAAMAPAAAVWAAWPKRASGVATDITEDVVRALALPDGLVDVKVCAIDATWSGLKLVIRKALRP